MGRLTMNAIAGVSASTASHPHDLTGLKFIGKSPENR
jgi:hypothetical protein